MSAVPAVLLPVGDDLYAVPIGWVREVVPAPVLTPLVTAPALVLGLFNLRGQIVPLLDTAALLGLGPAGPVGFVLVLQSRDGLLGLAATGLPQRAELDEQVGPSELPGTAGSYQVDGRVAVLVDPAVLLRSVQLRGTEHALPAGSA
ncbi:MAG TPA: chemotaxis protein CheW [Mycobacteriales bacterium]|nr:chemotaxis protein CheW [Mycobacteriales bacterium]